MTRSIQDRSRGMRRRLALIALAGLLGGCGYHFAASGSGLPAQAKTLYVENFSNHTRFTGINDEFMRYLKDEIANHKRLALVDTPDEADLVLNGEVRSLETRPLASNAVGEPLIYSASLSATATLTDAHTHQVVWTSQGIGAVGQAPAVSSSVLTTSPRFLQQSLRSQDIGNLPDLQLAQTQRGATRQYNMEQLAQNLYTSMAEGF